LIDCLIAVITITHYNNYDKDEDNYLAIELDKMI